jgi:hypothetical protein
MKNFIIGALIIGIAIVVGFALVQPDIDYGASSGPTHYNLEYFYGGLIQGGVKTTLTTGTTTTMTAAQVCDSSLIEWSHTATAAGTTTFPTSAAIVSRCLAKDGDMKTFLFRNLTTLAASTTNIIAGTGMILLEPDGQNVLIGGGAAALVTMVRVSSTAVIVNIDELIDAD